MDPKTRLDDKEKRNIPPVIQKILEKDVQLTKQFVCFLLNFMPVKSLQRHCKFLEVSTVNKTLQCISTKSPSGFLSWNFMARRLVSILLDVPRFSTLQSNAGKHVHRSNTRHNLCSNHQSSNKKEKTYRK